MSLATPTPDILPKVGPVPGNSRDLQKSFYRKKYYTKAIAEERGR